MLQPAVLALAVLAGVPAAQAQFTDARGVPAAPDGGETGGAYPVASRATVTVAPGRHYNAGSLRTFLFGDAYGEVWRTPIPIPLLDLERTAGGLTPTERGGGLQTISLQLRGGDGHDYVLRSVDKYPARAMPEGMRRTIVADVAQGTIPALNPYGAFILPRLAEAAGILHTVPTLVVVPDDPRLGEHREAFAGMVALFERRPDEDQSDAPNFGFSRNVIGSEKLLEEVQEAGDQFVDQRAYARARLFDMLIGDWDRHDDQWRWAEFETQEGTRYVAVPRDRDFAFVKYEGMLMRMARGTNNVVLRKLANFEEEIDDVLGLNWQGSKLDLRFTAALTREDWVEIARELQRALPDAVIEQAVRQWPEPVYREIGSFTADALKSRRDQLPGVAEAYYEMLARIVDVVATDEPERFEVTRLPEGDARVVVYRATDDRVRYDRTFRPGETEEVRLYGLGGDDRFVVLGEAGGKLRIRAIGGEGDDAFRSAELAASAARATYFYDTKTGNTWDVQPGTRVHRTSYAGYNDYAMRRFERDLARPVLSFDYDSDNGVFFGGGVRFVRQGFGKKPYAATHEIEANYAPIGRTFNAGYDGHLVRFWRGWDVVLEGDVLAADELRTFYGLGNETARDARWHYRAGLQRAMGGIRLAHPVGRYGYFEIGPAFTYTDVEPPDGLSEETPGLAFTRQQLTDTYFGGVASAFVFDSRDSSAYTTRGLRWEVESGVFADVRATDQRYARFASDVRFYQAIPLPGTPVLALRAGGAHNLGSFAFYQANTLGGRENLRGFPTSRFAGRTSAYANAELRLKLMPFNVYLTRGTLGVLGFYDTGRVWADGERSGHWHQGYGGGLWLTPYERFLMTATAGVSREGTLFDLSFGFQF